MHPGRAERPDDLGRQAGPDMRVVERLVLVRGELGPGGRDEQLEQPATVAGAHPVVQPPHLLDLGLLQLGGVVRVELDQHLDPVRVELLDVGAEIVAVLEREPVGPAHLGRHGQHETGLLGLARDVGAKLLIDQHAQAPAAQVLADHLPGRLEDHRLGLAHAGDLLRRGRALHAEQRPAERVAVIHRQDEQRLRCRRRGRYRGLVGHRASRYWGWAGLSYCGPPGGPTPDPIFLARRWWLHPLRW
jgi:hypothetical protein